MHSPQRLKGLKGRKEEEKIMKKEADFRAVHLLTFLFFVLFAFFESLR